MESDSVRISRRALLRGGTGLVLAASLSRLAPACGGKGAPASPPLRPRRVPRSASAYRSWEDVYRTRWTWDRVVRGTHTMTNCVSGCAWNLYVKDGVVWREEQQAPYEASTPGLPDFNPRGCQKGGCASALMYSPSRLRYPLRRVGARGEGRWQRISWEEALTEVARAIVDALERDGPESVILELGPNVGAGPNSAAPLRFFRLLGAPATDSMAQIGDLSTGATITFGNGHPCGSSDDWWRSSCLVLWAFNPSATRIPDTHFLWEARYRGAQVVVVSPDYNNSAIHADLWINPRPGTDAALALGAAQVLLSEGLFDAEYVARQTDLPLLVRSDTGRFLRESDLRPGGSEERFYVWDRRSGGPALAPGSAGGDLSDDKLAPALEHRGRVRTARGEVEVRTVFSLLRERLDREYTPEQVARVTGVSAALIRRFARMLARAPSALILSQWGQCKFLHGDLAQRAQILLVSLTGNVGRAGGGWRAGGFFAPEGFVLLALQEKLDLFHLGWFAARSYLDREGAEREFASGFVPGNLWHAVHSGLAATQGAPEYGDRAAPRPATEYLREALERKWFPVPADPKSPPRVALSIFGNLLRHGRNNTRLAEQYWNRIGLCVDVNFRMSETGLSSDIVLPAAFWYEKVDLKYLVSFVPYVHLGDRAVRPLGEAKPEWEIFARLAAAVQREARARALPAHRDRAGNERDPKRIGDAFTDRGRFGPTDEDAALDFILRYSSPTRGVSLRELRQLGAVRFRGTGAPGGTAGFFSDYSEHEPLVPHRWFVERNRRWPTLTGRQQFYVDHPWFLECGEALPVHKTPPEAGGRYPLVLSGGHTRWSIHAQWRDQALMLRLQRGEPVAYVNEADAAARGIRDNDLIRVRNDLGEFTIRAKVARYVRPGMIFVYHAWEPYQFRNRRNHHAVTPSPFKPTALAGDYGHLRWTYAHWEPNQVDRDTRVEIEPVSPQLRS